MSFSVQRKRGLRSPSISFSQVQQLKTAKPFCRVTSEIGQPKSRVATIPEPS